MSNWSSVLIWMATYWLHSTFLLGGVWLGLQWRKPASHALRESAWKLAALGAFLTASLQLGFKIETPINAALNAVWNSRSTASEMASDASEPIRPQHVAELRPNIVSEPSARTVAPFELYVPDIRTSTVESEDPELLEFSDATFATGNSDSRLPQEAISDAQLANHIGMAPGSPASRSVAPENGPTPPAGKKFERASKSNWRVSVRWMSLAFVMASGGAILALSLMGLLKLIWCQVGFTRRMHSCRTIRTGPAREILDRLLIDASVRRKVILLLADDTIEPGAWGLLTWRIVLPPRAVDELASDELQALLAHELAHLVRGDTWWIWTGHLLSVCFGWQPLNRLAFRHWRQASEYLCDAWAVEHRVARISLARCLTSVAGWRLASAVPLAGVGGENRTTLSHRVERLIDDQPLRDPWLNRGRRQLVAAAAGCFALLTVCCAPTAMLGANANQVSAVSTLPVEQEAAHDTIPGLSQSEFIPTSQFVGVAAVQKPEEPLEQLTLDVRHATLSLDRSPAREMTQIMLHEVAADLTGLNRELAELEAVIDGSERFLRSPQYEAQAQRFRIRLQTLVHMRETVESRLKM